jgi:hypothetical protein
MPDETDKADDRIRREDGHEYEERREGDEPDPPADDPNEDEVPPLTEPGAET